VYVQWKEQNKRGGARSVGSYFIIYLRQPFLALRGRRRCATVRAHARYSANDIVQHSRNARSRHRTTLSKNCGNISRRRACKSARRTCPRCIDALTFLCPIIHWHRLKPRTIRSKKPKKNAYNRDSGLVPSQYIFSPSQLRFTVKCGIGAA